MSVFAMTLPETSLAPPASGGASALSSLRDLPNVRETQIVFLSAPVTRITGGIKYMFRMAEALHRAGCNVVVSEPNQMRPTWFSCDVPIEKRTILGKHPRQLVVVPEDIQESAWNSPALPRRRVMYCQNHFYAAKSAPIGRTYADVGVSHVLCSGRAIYDYCRHRHPQTKAHLIPCSVDPALFHPRPKRERIACIPRKRQVEAAFLEDLFRFNYPEYRDIEWLPLVDKSESEIASALGSCSVFLALSRLEGFGLTPVEAMASGCVVAGFTGGGGWEYATSANGFWADEDDFSTCVRQLAEAVRLSRDTGPQRVAYSAACMRAIAPYTPARYEESLGAAWTEILTHHA